MRFTMITAIVVTALGGAAYAEPSQLTDSRAFATTVVDRPLTALGVKLVVGQDGSINGTAFGRTVTGSWHWDQGYFCREMTFGEQDLGSDCQAVVLEGDRVRFIADRGAGQEASLRLR